MPQWACCIPSVPLFGWTAGSSWGKWPVWPTPARSKPFLPRMPAHELQLVVLSFYWNVPRYDINHTRKVWSPVRRSSAWGYCHFILSKWLRMASSTDPSTPTVRTGRMTLTLSLVISWRWTKGLCCHWVSKRVTSSTPNASAGSWALMSEPNRGETFRGHTCSMWDLWKCQCRPASLVLRDRFLLFPDLSQQPPRRVRLAAFSSLAFFFLHCWPMTDWLA